MSDVPQLLHTVLDAVDVRHEADFWRDLLGLDVAHERVLALGGELRFDRTDDLDEPLRAYASPAGHVFCVFVA